MTSKKPPVRTGIHGFRLIVTFVVAVALAHRPMQHPRTGQQ